MNCDKIQRRKPSPVPRARQGVPWMLIADIAVPVSHLDAQRDGVPRGNQAGRRCHEGQAGAGFRRNQPLCGCIHQLLLDSIAEDERLNR